MDVIETLFEMADSKYADFQAKLTPTLERELFIGVRVPEARRLAKSLYRSGDYKAFLQELPHKYFDENILHALIVSEIKDYETCTAEVNRFLPYIDNWAVCDILSPRCFSRHREKVLLLIREWAQSAHVYTCRFGIEMLMTHFLDKDFSPELLDIPAAVSPDDYYIQMMIAWFFATALAKQWAAAIPYLEENRLEPDVCRKTIRKARESRRITDDQKAYLRTLVVSDQANRR